MSHARILIEVNTTVLALPQVPRTRFIDLARRPRRRFVRAIWERARAMIPEHGLDEVAWALAQTGAPYWTEREGYQPINGRPVVAQDWLSGWVTPVLDKGEVVYLACWDAGHPCASDFLSSHETRGNARRALIVWFLRQDRSIWEEAHATWDYEKDRMRR